MNDGSCVCSANSYDNLSGECICSNGYTEIVTGVCAQCKTYLKANQVQYAQFESTYSSINVKFDVEIDTRNLYSCDDFILYSSLAKFGSDYECKWKENNTLLVITLGNGTALGAETLSLNG